MSFWQLTCPENRPLVIDATTNTQFNYQDLQHLVSSFEKTLNYFKQKTLGIIFCRNNIDSLVVYLACLRTKHAVILLDADLNQSLALKLIETYQPDWIFLPKESSSVITNYQCHSDFLTGLWYVSMTNHETLIHPDLALLLSTSGSTGSPKMVRLSYQNLATNAESIAEYLQLSDSERPITTLPMHYSYGLSVINSHLHVNATLLLTQASISTREFWDFASRQQATSMAGVPYTYQMFKQIRIENIELPSLRTLTQAGGRLSTPLVKYFTDLSEKKSWQFYVMYGQTEATARISYVPLNILKEKPDSIGVAIPKGKLSIDAETSELIYQGPNVMMGYAESSEDLAKGDELNGLLKTGDFAKQDKDGFFSITGRSKRFLKLFGLRINLEEVEAMLESDYQLYAASAGNDEKLHIFIENAQKIHEVKDCLIKRYQLHPTAIQIRHVDKIPRSARGKPDYMQLQAMIEV